MRVARVFLIVPPETTAALPGRFLEPFHRCQLVGSTGAARSGRAKNRPQEIFDSDHAEVVSNPPAASKRKSAVYGLNGRRANLVITLSLGTYEHAI
jgi:hypothetical protein